MKRRRLNDLYARGVEVTLDDGTDQPVTIWLQKLSPIDRDTALRRGNAAQARFMIEADDESSETFQAMYANIREMGEDRDSLVGFLIAEDLTKYRESVASERGMDEETWAKEGYLQGLMDAWLGDDDNPGLAAVQAEDPEDPEAKRVMGEITRFENEIQELVTAERERLVKDWVDVPDDAIWRKSTHKMLELRGHERFNTEYERQVLFFAVRDPEAHAQRYFSTVSEVDDLDETVHAVLQQRYANLIVGPMEGKSLPASQDSSNSSGPSPEVEVSAASGPEAASG